MKDPIQKTLTPYEVLDLNPSTPIDKKRIDFAFNEKFDKKGAKEAQTILNDPVKRALVDVFMYSDKTLALMASNVYSDLEHLIKNRYKIGKSWKKSQRKYFPFYPLTHLSAVFWYWWLIYEEEKLWSERGEGSMKAIPEMPESPPIDELWKDTIGNWVSLINCDGFWFDWIREISIPDFSEKDSLLINELKNGVEEKIKNHISDFSERYRSRGNISEANRFNNYSLWYSEEKNSSGDIFRSGLSRSIKGREYFYSSGRMLLERLDIQDDLVSLLEIEISKEPENKALKKVMSLFTSFEEPYFIEEAVKDDGSLQKKSLPYDSTRPEEDTKSTESELILKKGKQLLSEGNLEEVVDLWKCELKSGLLETQHVDRMIDIVKDESILVKKNDPDKAIGMLESFIEVLPDKALLKNLSSIYLSRGISRMNNSIKKIPIGTAQSHEDVKKVIFEMAVLKDEIKTDTEKGLADMQKAAELNPENKNALTQIKMGLTNLQDIELLDIYKAIELKDLDYASKKLKVVLKLNPDNKKAKELLETSSGDFCWFCENKNSPNFPDPDSALGVKMYKITSMDLSSVKWQILDIDVPRCSECVKAHNKKLSPLIIPGIVAVSGLLISIIMSILANNFSVLYFLIVNAISIGGGALIYLIDSESEGESLCYDISHSNNFPFIKKKSEEGWEFGDKPIEITETPHIERVN